MGLSTNLKVHIALFSVSLLYAILFSMAGQIMPNYLDPGLFVWMRVCVASLFFLIMFILSKNKYTINWKADGKELLLCSILGTSGNMLMFFYGLSYTLPINGAVLMLFSPIVVVCYEHIKHKIKPQFLQIVGLLTAAICAYILITYTAKEGTNKGSLFGDILIAINAIFYGAYLVRVKKLFIKYNHTLINLSTFSLAIILVMPFGVGSIATTQFSKIPFEIWLKIGYILTFTTFVVYQLNSYAVKNGSAQLAAVYIYLQPVLAAAIAITLGTDSFSILKLTLCIIIILGVWLVGKFKPVIKD